LNFHEETNLRIIIDNDIDNMIKNISEFITAWCRKNNKGDPKQKDINDAIT
jgi:hypothetical protein